LPRQLQQRQVDEPLVLEVEEERRMIRGIIDEVIIIH
jgi:hypothetical protein